MLFSSYSWHLSYVVFILQLVFKLCCFHHPASTLQRTISSIQVIFKQRSFSSSSLYFAKNYFINPDTILATFIFIIQLLLCKELFHQSKFYLNNAHFHHPSATCTLQRTISSILVPLSQELFNLFRFYLRNVLFIISITRTLCVKRFRRM